MKNAGKGPGKSRRNSVRGRGDGALLSEEEWTAVRCFIQENLTVDIAARCAEACGADAVRFGDEIYLMPYAAQFPAAGLKIVRCGLHLGTLKKGRFEPAHALAMALRPEEAVHCVNFRSSCGSDNIGSGEETPTEAKEDAVGRRLPGEDLQVTCPGAEFSGESLEAACGGMSLPGESPKATCPGAECCGESLKAACTGAKLPGERSKEGCEGTNLPGESPEAAAFLRGEALPCAPQLKGWILIAFDGISAGWAKASGGMLRNHYPKGLRRGQGHHS